MFLAIHIVIMIMPMLFFRNKVVMPMLMCNHMGMRDSIMGMNDCMRMSVRMVLVHCVIYNKNGTNKHKD